MKGVPERTTGSWTRGEFAKEKGKHGTHVSDSNGEKEEKDPEVQVEPFSRGSTLVGYPERKKPEQSCRVEGNCEISLYAKKIYISSKRESRITTHCAPAR